MLQGEGPLVENNCTSCAYLDINVVDYEIQGMCRFQIDESCFYEYDYSTSGNASIVVRKCMYISQKIKRAI